MGRICGLFIVVRCSAECGYSEIYNEPTEEQAAEIDERTRCPRCGATLERAVF